MENDKEKVISKGTIFSIILNVILLLTLIIVSILFYLKVQKEPNVEYVERKINANINEDIKQKTYTSNNEIIISFLGPSTNTGTEIEVTLYDNSNKTVAILTKNNNDVGFDKYPYEYIFSIQIKKSQYPTAATAKITAYRYTLYEKHDKTSPH